MPVVLRREVHPTHELFLPALNRFIMKLKDPLAIQADNMIVMLLIGQLIVNLAIGVSRALLQNAALNEHGQIAIKGGLAHFGVPLAQALKELRGSEVPRLMHDRL